MPVDIKVRFLQLLSRVRLAQKPLQDLERRMRERPWVKPLVGFVQSYLTTLEGLMDTVAADLCKAEYADVAMTIMEQCASKADRLQEFVSLMSLAHGRYAPQVFYSKLLELESGLPPENDHQETDQARQPPAVLITAGERPRNYEVTTEPFRLEERALKRALKRIDKEVQFLFRPAVVKCPPREFGDALQHAAIFHEYGHAFLGWLGLELEFAADQQLSFFGFVGDKNKGQELQADAIAAYIAGPAPALALAYKSAQAGETYSYPSLAQRIAVTVECLKSEPEDDYISWAVDRLIAAGGQDVAIVDDTLKETIHDSLQDFYPYVDNYASTRPSTKVRHLVQRIGDYVPPDLLNKRSPWEVGNNDIEYTLDVNRDIPSIQDILNAGWYVRLEKEVWEQFMEGLGLSPECSGDNIKAEGNLNALLMKAMETVGLVAKFETPRKERERAQ